jgi:hypothetical protein
MNSSTDTSICATRVNELHTCQTCQPFLAFSGNGGPSMTNRNLRPLIAMLVAGIEEILHSLRICVRRLLGAYGQIKAHLPRRCSLHFFPLELPRIHLSPFQDLPIHQFFHTLVIGFLERQSLENQCSYFARTCYH